MCECLRGTAGREGLSACGPCFGESKASVGIHPTHYTPHCGLQIRTPPGLAFLENVQANRSLIPIVFAYRQCSVEMKCFYLPFTVTTFVKEAVRLSADIVNVRADSVSDLASCIYSKVRHQADMPERCLILVISS